MNLHEQFKGGFTHGSGIRTEEILHDDRVTNAVSYTHLTLPTKA